MALIKLYANLRHAAGLKEISIEGCSLGEVMMELVNQFPVLSVYLLEDGQIRRHVIITINGQPTMDMEAAVSAQDQIAIFPPIAGG